MSQETSEKPYPEDERDATVSKEAFSPLSAASNHLAE